MPSICSVCLTSEILCKGCSFKLEKGEFSNLDVSVARAMHAAGVTPSAERAVETESDIFIIAPAEKISPLIGPGGRNVKKLSAALGRNVRIVQQDSERSMIEAVLGVHVIGVNVVYGNGEIRRIRIHRKKLDLKRASATLEKIFSKRYEIVME